MRKRAVLVGLASLFVVYGCVFSAAATPADPTAWNLKTSAPEAQKYKPFLDAISSLRSDVDKSDKIPADAASRLNQVKGLAGAFHQESQMLISALKQNNETAAFDGLIAARLNKAGRSTTASEIQKLGGASAILANSRRAIDEDLSDLTSRVQRSMPEKAVSSILGGLLELLEPRSAEAGLYVYGGGVKGTCPYWLIVYYLSIGVDPSYCVYR